MSMEELRRRLEKFLEEHGVLCQGIDISREVEKFCTEMETGLSGTDSSLAMLPTFVKRPSSLPTDKRVVAVDVGGTHMRVAFVLFPREGQPTIEGLKKYPMMASANENLTKKQFFDMMAERVEPFLRESGELGFCFSYPTEILPSRDARILQLTKQISVPGVEGELLIENLQNALDSRKGARIKRSVVLNDAVATLLAGVSEGEKRRYESYLGLILGTGINLSYEEENSAIGKARFFGMEKEGSQIINVEAGGYGLLSSRGEIDRRLDEKTVDPGIFGLEKMVSGRYFGAMAYEAILFASQQGVIDPSVEKLFEGEPPLVTREADKFLHNPHDLSNRLAALLAEASLSSRQGISLLLDALLDRAACAVAIAIAGVITHRGVGQDPLHPVCIAVEGTTFFSYHRFLLRLTIFLDRALGKRYHYEFRRVREAPLLGAALAILEN